MPSFCGQGVLISCVKCGRRGMGMQKIHISCGRHICITSKRHCNQKALYCINVACVKLSEDVCVITGETICTGRGELFALCLEI